MKLVNRGGQELDAEFVVEPLDSDTPGFDVILRSRCRLAQRSDCGTTPITRRQSDLVAVLSLT